LEVARSILEIIKPIFLRINYLEIIYKAQQNLLFKIPTCVTHINSAISWSCGHWFIKEIAKRRKSHRS